MTEFHLLEKAPKPVAPFSHAVEIDGWIFVTGQMPTYPDDPDKALPEGIKQQTKRVMENLKIVLGELNSSLADVVQMRVYLTNFDDDYASMNETYRSYFTDGKLPARTCVGVSGLAVNALG